MRAQYSPYTAQSKKDIPLAVIVIAGIAIWVLIFGSVFVAMLIFPCGFTKALVGEETFMKFQNPELRSPPCNPARTPSCIAWKLDNRESCSCFLRFTLIGKSCEE